MAKEEGEALGSRAANLSRTAGEGLASLPPFTGSITTTGLWWATATS